jgi:UDP-glucose 4-epimerase
MTRPGEGAAGTGAVLVTGGAGFIGSHVADELVALGYDVTVLDDLSGGFLENVNPKARFVEGSILDAPLVAELFDQHRFRYVFHLAAYAAEGLSHYIKRYNYENNLIGSVNLINAAVNHDCECFVFTSSIAVYGAGQVPMREDLVPEPEDPYGIAKLAVETELRVSRRLFGLNHIVFRPHNVYGERQNIGDRYRNVIGIFMNQVMRGQPLTIFGDGSQTRAFTYIRDVAPVIARAVTVPAAYNEVFNIGGDTPYAVGALAAAVCRAMGMEAALRHLAPRLEVKHAYCDHAKARKVLHYEPAWRLHDGLAAMAAWAKSTGSRDPKEFGALEILRNLPEGWQPADRKGAE